MSKMKTFAYAAPTAYVTKFGKDLRAAGYEVTRTADTMVAKMDDVEVARCMKMRNVWVVRALPEVVQAA